MNVRKDEWTVGAWMTENPQTVAPDLSVRSAFFKMRIEGYRHLLVVEGDTFKGILSDRDLRRPDLTGEPDGWDDFYRLDGDYEVRDVMTNDAKTVRPSDSIEKALRLLLEYKFNALPVLDKTGKAIGILSTFDLLRAFEKAIEQTGDTLRK